jgi:HD-like signal output (HDOD) protein
MNAPPVALPRLPRELASWTAWFARAPIPVLSQTAETIELMRANEDAVDANLLGEAMASDPLMSLKVLAHAATHRHPRLLTDAETVTAALVMMGIGPFFRAFGPQPTIDDHLADNPSALAGLTQVLHRASRAARFALGFAVHRMDGDAAVIHEAALLHDFAEMLLWCHAPQAAVRIRELQAADATLRSRDAQRAVLGIELGELEQTLMKHWRLPELLVRMTDDRHVEQPQVRCVSLAIRLARHTAAGWDNPAVPDDVAEVADLLNLASPSVTKLLREIDG